MKKFFFAALMLVTAFANAADVTVLEANLPAIRSRDTDVDTRFYIDTTTHEGFVKVAVSERRVVYSPYEACRYNRHGYCNPGPGGYYGPTRVDVTVFTDTVKVDGLMLMGDKVIYHGEEGDVDCGTMGTSRVFRRPTLYLSGNCTLHGKVVRSREGEKVVVTLKTK